MSNKVVKLIVVVDADTADRIEQMSEMSVKEREATSDRFIMDRSDVPVELHFVAGEVV